MWRHIYSPTLGLSSSSSWTLSFLVLQRVFRGKRARYAANIIRRRHHGALAYQRVYRGYLGRCVTWGRRLRCRAAKVLQVSESGLSRALRSRVLNEMNNARLPFPLKRDTRERCVRGSVDADLLSFVVPSSHSSSSCLFFITALLARAQNPRVVPRAAPQVRAPHSAVLESVSCVAARAVHGSLPAQQGRGRDGA